ncbi:MAG: anti-sigma factor [Hyphomicrobiales bacterium]|nr:MAG: anti-sigma factor [Hyphomicrobiales bacterium]
MSGGSARDDDIGVLAASFVTGLMDEPERRAFEQRLAQEPALRAAVEAARVRFLEIDVAARPVAASAGLWDRIASGLDGERRPISLAAARRASAAAPSAPTRPSTNRAFWQGFAAASLAAVLIGGSLWTALWPRAPRLVVVLLDAQARPVSIVETFEGQTIRVVPLGNIEIPQGRTLQVWTLPDPATGPVSIGLLPGASATTLKGPSLPAPKLDQLYEITIEAAGGSPTGKPTGPIVGKGFAKAPQI